MTRRAVATLLMAALTLSACTQNATPPRDPGKVVLPVKQVSVPGRLYATKGRSLYVFSGTHLTKLLAGVRVKASGSCIQLTAESCGRTARICSPTTSASGATTSRAGSRSGWSRRSLTPGATATPRFVRGANEQLLYTTYLYGGAPLEPVARLTWRSVRTGARVYLSPDGPRYFQPAFSPDGRFVAFVHAGSGSDDLSVMPLAAGFSRELRPEPTQAAVQLQAGIVSQPVWAPDGSAIAFLMLVNGSFDLFIIPITTAPDGAVRVTGPGQAVTHGSFLDADRDSPGRPDVR